MKRHSNRFIKRNLQQLQEVRQINSVPDHEKEAAIIAAGYNVSIPRVYDHYGWIITEIRTGKWTASRKTFRTPEEALSDCFEIVLGE